MERRPEGNILFPVDPTSGTALPDYPPISLGEGPSEALSPDVRTLAVVSFPNQTVSDGSLLLIDLATWKTQRFKLGLTGSVNTMVFSPDGKRLAIAHGDSGYQLTLVDVNQGVISAQVQIEFFRLPFEIHRRRRGLDALQSSD